MGQQESHFFTRAPARTRRFFHRTSTDPFPPTPYSPIASVGTGSTHDGGKKARAFLDLHPFYCNVDSMKTTPHPTPLRSSECGPLPGTAYTALSYQAVQHPAAAHTQTGTEQRSSHRPLQGKRPACAGIRQADAGARLQQQNRRPTGALRRVDGMSGKGPLSTLHVLNLAVQRAEYLALPSSLTLFPQLLFPRLITLRTVALHKRSVVPEQKSFQ